MKMQYFCFDVFRVFVGYVKSYNFAENSLARTFICKCFRLKKMRTFIDIWLQCYIRSFLPHRIRRKLTFIYDSPINISFIRDKSKFRHGWTGKHTWNTKEHQINGDKHWREKCKSRTRDGYRDKKYSFWYCQSISFIDYMRHSPFVSYARIIGWR